MNLNELEQSILNSVSRSVDPESVYWRKQDQTRYLLEQSGFESINEGEGCYCYGVGRHPDIPNKVYKLVTTDVYQDGYLAYARWLLETRWFDKNPHFPRIYDIKETDDVALVVIEELQEFDWYTAPEFLKQDWLLSLRLTRPKTFLRLYAGDTMVDLNHINGPFATALDAFMDHFADLPFSIDIHKGNVMIRNGMTMVINDPLA